MPSQILVEGPIWRGALPAPFYWSGKALPIAAAAKMICAMRLGAIGSTALREIAKRSPA